MTNYDHYHAHYDNASYACVQSAFVRDVFGDDVADNPAAVWKSLAEEPVHTLLNVVTDVALHISGVTGHERALMSLVILILQHKLSDTTVQIIADHLRKFEHPGDVAVDDMLNTLNTIRHAQTAMNTLTEAIQKASDIHGKEGRAAYHLLKSASALVTVAELLLKAENSKAYLNEKLMRSASALADALIEIQQIYP